jgi:hypothetical protein
MRRRRHARSEPLQPRLAALAAAQGGPFLAKQALAVGYAKGQIQHLVRSRQWIPLRHGIYVTRDLADASGQLGSPPRELAIAAAILAIDGTVASHESAADILRLPVPAIPERITLTRPRWAASGMIRLRGVAIYRAEVPAQHRCVRNGIGLTTPARTVSDLARALPFRQGVMVADAALHTRMVTLPGLRAVLADCRGWPGICRARQVIDFADPKAESALESAGRVVFAEQGLPPPQTQVRIMIGSSVFARVDFYWKRFRTIAETDGLLKYSGSDVLRREKLRQEALADLGYEVVRITWQQLHEDPAEVAARVRRAFARAACNRTPTAATA